MTVEIHIIFVMFLFPFIFHIIFEMSFEHEICALPSVLTVLSMFAQKEIITGMVWCVGDERWEW